MLNAMVAATKRQAEAMIVLLKLNPHEWESVVYGQPIKKLFGHAKLIRPSEGVERSHCDWVLEQLVPNLALSVTTVPPNWKIPQEHFN